MKNRTSLYKITIILLWLVLPIFAIGYYFAVKKESLFYLYEWALTIDVIAIAVLSLKNVLKKDGINKAQSVSMLGFSFQFMTLILFFGPFSQWYPMFYIHYLMVLFSFGAYVYTFKTSKEKRYLPILFAILTLCTLAIVIFIQVMWNVT